MLCVQAFAEAVRKVFAHAQENNPPDSAIVRDSRRASGMTELLSHITAVSGFHTVMSVRSFSILAAVFERVFAAWVTSEDRPVSADLYDNSCPSCGRTDGFEDQSVRCELCEGCYHLKCANLQEPPVGSWFCRTCGRH